ncbi:MAG: helix-turn-helix domain-containing protein [Clostridia bacterium]|nr:helix-turn-helix domain-containing protein [Clostridia bacterium]
MEFESAAKAAERLGVTVRAVQKWAKDGKLPGAKQLGRSWMIPADAQIPASGVQAQEDIAPARSYTPFPLLNTSFAPGHALEAAMAIEDEDERAIALGEYYYFTGQVELTARAAEPYLEHDDSNVALSANLMYVFSNVSIDEMDLVRQGLDRIRRRATAVIAKESDPVARANAILFGTAASVLLRVPNTDVTPLKKVLSVLPRALQFFGCYILSHAAYLNQEYDHSRGIAEIALALGGDAYPLASNYLRTMLCIDLMCLRRTEEAKQCFDRLWSTVWPDGGIEVIGEHHLLMLGLPEICLKRQEPEQYKQLIAVTKRFGVSWKKAHHHSTGRSIADGLSLMEYTIATMYNRGWAVKEIALHMELSERMIKHHIAMIYEKLGISSREELRRLTQI